jgi:hypothetical protein
MLDEMVARQPPSGGEPASLDRLPSIGVSLQRAIPRRVASQQSPLPLHRVSFLSCADTCDSNIEMAPLCKIDVTPPRVLGPRGLRRGGVVDEQAGVQPS